MSSGIKKKKCKLICKIPYCKNGRYSGDKFNKHFYRFPRKEDLLKKWKTICSIAEDVNCENFKVCEDHFFRKDFVNCSHHRLNPGVVPRHLKYVLCPTIEQPNSPSNTGDNVSECNSISPVCDFWPSLGDAKEEPYKFLCSPFEEDGEGVIGNGVAKSEVEMDKIHKITMLRLSKLKTLLKNEKEQLRVLRRLYRDKRFEIIESNLNNVSNDFIHSQLKNSNQVSHGRRCSVDDKVFALSFLKESPHLYLYLCQHFSIPSTRLLKSTLSKIPFDVGINEVVFGVLSKQAKKMCAGDKYCALLFDEISLNSGLYYECNEQHIIGYQDLGHLGRSLVAADHALVFMLRGIRQTWKQVVAYYFTSNGIQGHQLKALIVHIISEIQKIGFKIVSTVCDQNMVNQEALTELCEANLDRPSEYHFVVNNEPIAIIYDVPHLLKNTRNALINNGIQFGDNKVAKLEHIKQVFNFDLRRSFRILYKLTEADFNFTDRFVKTNVAVAAAQMSYKVAAAIETYVKSFHFMPSEAMFTAEFAVKIDSLFDSLNSCNQYDEDEWKKFRCVVSENSPHTEMWHDMLEEMESWKLIELGTGCVETQQLNFIQGWMTTLKSFIFLWNRLKLKGFDYLNTKAFNQDPLDNLFFWICQHGISDANPTCPQFVDALKTYIINNMPYKFMSNCENDNCMPMSNLRQFLNNVNDDESESDDDIDEFIREMSVYCLDMET